MTNRPDIPEAMKREVRQRCFFGCVICGAPVFHYEHIEDYKEVQVHEIENITLLCPNHHQDKTSKRISREIIRNCTNKPFNCDKTFSSPYRLFLVGNESVLRVGSNEYYFIFSNERTQFDAIRLCGKRIVGLTNENGSLLLDLCMTDKNGNEIVRVNEGELEISTEIWDFQYEGTNMKMRSHLRKIEFDMSLLDNGVQINRGYFSMPPISLEISPEKHIVWPQGHTMIGCKSYGCRVGLDVNLGQIAMGVA